MDKKKNDVKQAVALEYNPDDQAPKILAIGQGLIADKIIDEAKKNDIPVHEDAKLADTLSKWQVGDFIPPELYQAVAEVLVFVDAMDKIKAKMDKNK